MCLCKENISRGNRQGPQILFLKQMLSKSIIFFEKNSKMMCEGFFAKIGVYFQCFSKKFTVPIFSKLNLTCKNDQMDLMVWTLELSTDTLSVSKINTSFWVQPFPKYILPWKTQNIFSYDHLLSL